jgi:hypothetical protein
LLLETVTITIIFFVVVVVVVVVVLEAVLKIDEGIKDN